MRNTSLRRLGIIAMLPLLTVVSGCAIGAGHSKEPMASVFVWKNADYGPMTAGEYAVAARQANDCAGFADAQIRSRIGAILNGTISGAVSGGVGVGGGGEAGRIGDIANFGPYGAVAGAANGAVNGNQQHASARTSMIGTCTGANLEDARTRMPGVHATPAYVGTRNRSDEIPSWVVAGPAEPIVEDAPEEGYLPTRRPPR